MPRCATERAHRTVEGECSLSRDVGSFSVFRGCVCVCHELSQMVTSLCPPTPASPPLANGAQRLRSVLGSLTGTPPPGDEVSERGFNSGSRADRESREREPIFSIGAIYSRLARVWLVTALLADRTSSRFRGVPRPTLRPTRAGERRCAEEEATDEAGDAGQADTRAERVRAPWASRTVARARDSRGPRTAQRLGARARERETANIASGGEREANDVSEFS